METPDYSKKKFDILPMEMDTLMHQRKTYGEVIIDTKVINFLKFLQVYITQKVFMEKINK